MLPHRLPAWACVTHTGLLSRPDGVNDLLVDSQLTDQTSVTGGDTVTIDPGPGRRPGTTGLISIRTHPRRAGDARSA
ncbi:hypothetical protein ACIOBK_00610 [Micromonospora chokoriensis]